APSRPSSRATPSADPLNRSALTKGRYPTGCRPFAVPPGSPSHPATRSPKSWHHHAMRTLQSERRRGGSHRGAGARGLGAGVFGIVQRVRVSTQIVEREASQHAGVVTASRLAALGADRAWLSRQVTSGRWQRLHRGVLLTHSGPVPWS